MVEAARYFALQPTELEGAHRLHAPPARTACTHRRGSAEGDAPLARPRRPLSQLLPAEPEPRLRLALGLGPILSSFFMRAHAPPSPPPHPNPPPRPHPAPRAHLGQASTACACCTPFGSSCSGDGTRRARLRLRLLRRACGRAASRRRHGRRPLRLPRYVSSGRRMRFRRSPLRLRRKPRRLRTCPERMRAVGAATSTTGSTTKP